MSNYVVNSKMLGLVSATILATLSLSACQKPAEPKPAEAGASTPSSTATATPSAMAGKTIRIATEGTYKPFSITNADGSLSGFDVDYMKALCSEMQANCDIKPQDWDGLLPSLLAKKYDVVIDAMSITPERQAQVDFTDPYFTNTLVFITKKGSPINPDDPAQIDSHAVAAQRSTLSTQWMEKNHPKSKLNLYENLDNAFMDLASGRSEMMIADKAPAYYWINTPDGKGFEVKGKEIDVDDKMGIIVRKGDPLKAELNKAIATTKANGVYDKIYNQYFGTTTTTNASATATTTQVASSASVASVTK
ncbi:MULTISPECIES: transporter substrate-binding domain-containing protein [unclassified Moraxella]|uniref:transporter substrate-binding domain-containing protein n=1 Tax=unclassified Moraxella TaxID=2685852 RepID=UPI003AF7BA43